MVIYMDYLTSKEDKDPGSRHSSFQNKEKSARWLRNTLSGMLNSAKEDTGLTDFEILAVTKAAIRKNDLEVSKE